VLRIHDGGTKVLGELMYRIQMAIDSECMCVFVGGGGVIFLKVNSIQLCMKHESLFESYSVACDRVF